jgi:RNA polymerase sigma-70 factor, ECF subfamily
MIVIVLPDIPQEDALLARARQGNREAIMQIYESYFSPIYQYIRLRVDDPTLAEDLASEVFMKLVSAFRGNKAPTHSLRGWLFKVARSLLHDHYSKSRKFTTTALDEWVPAPSDHEPEVEFIRSLNLERARDALRKLSPEQQEVLILRFGQALNLQQTADIMGKSISAVKSLQFRAVETLRAVLTEMRLEPDHG